MSEPSPNFSKVELTELLDTLSERLRRKRAVARLYVIGGACMALAYGRGDQDPAAPRARIPSVRRTRRGAGRIGPVRAG